MHHPRHQYDLGKKIHPGTLVLVETEAGYITYDHDLANIKKFIGVNPIPKEMIDDVKRVLKKRGIDVSIAEQIKQEIQEPELKEVAHDHR